MFARLGADWRSNDTRNCYVALRLEWARAHGTCMFAVVLRALLHARTGGLSNIRTKMIAFRRVVRARDLDCWP
eukprot:9032531-Lingulodinium_polyedra.AAC.1